MACGPCNEENPCVECGSVVPCNCCVDPSYSELGCSGEPINTSCIKWDGADDACIPIAKPVLLTTLLTNLIIYIKAARTRLTAADTSLTFTNTDDACDDKATVQVRIDDTTNGGDNILELTADGLYVPPPGSVVAGQIEVDDSTSINFTGNGSSGSHLTGVVIRDTVSNGGDNILTIGVNGVYVPPVSSTLCTAVTTVFTDDEAQKNTVAQNTYDFLISGVDGCEKVSPPLGFAVSGPTRKSAFGPMEWYSTLTLANAAAVSGETVLLFSDAPTEDLVPKNGVNYMGIGIRSIDDFTLLTPSVYVGNISNIKILGAVTISGAGSEIFASNVEIKKGGTFTNNVRWHGGRFTANSITYSVTITNDAFVEDIYSTIRVSIAQNGTLTKAVVHDTLAAGHFTVYVDATGTDYSPTITNCNIYSLNCIALYTLAYNPGGFITASNVVAISDGDIGAVIHGGNADEGGGNFSTNITGKSSVAAGVLIVSNKIAFGSPGWIGGSLTNWGVSNINGLSLVAPGINCINANLKHCNGYSVASHGIQIGGSDQNGYNLNITECIGESLGASGLRATRDIYIVGGTYISRKNAVDGYPILLNAAVLAIPQILNYYIAGVKTLAVNTNAACYAIYADSAVTARISGCQFLNENLSGSVPGIYHTGIGGNITLNAVTIDAYGNIR